MATNWPAGRPGDPSLPSHGGPVVRSEVPSPALAEALWSGGGASPLRAARWLAVLLGGVLVTAGLATVLHSLIKWRAQDEEDTAVFRNAQFIRLKAETQVRRRTRELPKRQKRQKQPKTPTMTVSKQASQLDLTTIKVPTPVGPSLGMGDLEIIGGPVVGSTARRTDQGYMPFVKVQPIYPEEARERELEGWVDLLITVTKNGSVTNPRVTHAEPPSVFNRAAISCVKKWKYRPKIKNGIAVAVSNVKARVTFQLSDD